jgi:5-methyltetrahydrofolate--homocysteine methyltransferase
LLAAFEDDKTTRSNSAKHPRPSRNVSSGGIIDGERRGIDLDLDEAMRTHRPLEIINDILLDGMKTVGDLFGAGRCSCPSCSSRPRR